MFIHSKPFCKQTEINDIDDIQHVSSTYCYLWICAFIFGVRSMFHSGLINDFDQKKRPSVAAFNWTYVDFPFFPMFPYGSVSKPCTPGEPQNSW